MSSLQLEMDRARALRVLCPYCHAAPDDACRDPRTGKAIQHQAAHLQRIRTADAKADQ